MKRLSNIALTIYRKFLKKVGCVYHHANGGHEVWYHPKVGRPITFQTHIDPVPERIVKQHMHYLNIKREDMDSLLSDC